MKYLTQDISLCLDVNRCIGCGMCETVCPHGVFAVESKKARILDRETCIECGACARNCPVDALAVASGVGCAEAIINGLRTGKETCCASGECCSSNPTFSEQNEKGGDTKMETKVKDQKQKKGLLAAIWESMTKTGGCCGSGKNCCGSSQPDNSKQKTKNKEALKDEQ